METSDSDYFESADEDVQSDDEDTKTVVKNTESDHTELNRKKLENLELSQKRTAINLSAVNNNKGTDITKSESLKTDDENNVDLCDSKQDTCAQSTTNQPNKVGDNNDKESIIIEECNKSEEDNLWDDSEINWEKQPEFSEKHKQDVTEENLWDDSEISWGKDDKNLWENDEWEPAEEHKKQTTSHTQEKSFPVGTSWGSWGNWGVSSIISTASQGVTTLTQGISNVLETGIGVPDPEELAKINKAEKEKLQEISSEANIHDKNQSFGLGNLVMGVSHLTKLVETTGTKVITGGLDTLETIGKKTMEVLQEGDPGLKKKRAFLKIDQDKPVLSQLLREAKEKAENENKILQEKHFAKRAKNYETLFDDHQGLVHLEALEMLSRQCDIKLQTLLESYTDEALIDMQETMEQVKELCELPNEDDDEQINNVEDIKDKLSSAVNEINIPISYKRLIDTWDETEIWLNNLKLDICDEQELHQQAIETLAQLTAIAVEQFHKTAELLLIKEHRSTADEADSLVQLTTTLTSLIGVVAAKFSDKLNAKSSSSRNKEEINGLITNVFFEAANSSSYIQDAFQLLIPVLQVGAV